MLALAVWGGEYGTADWITIRRQLAEERAKVAVLRVEIDSLAKLAHDWPDAQVIIQADAAASHGRVVEVMEAAKSVGIERLAIATEAQ